MTYLEKLHAFAARGPFKEAHIRQNGATGSWRLAEGDGCDCCGTHRLKVLYPLIKGGEGLYWVGKECWKQLDTMGLIKPWDYGDGFVQIEKGKLPYVSERAAHLQEVERQQAEHLRTTTPEQRRAQAKKDIEELF